MSINRGFTWHFFLLNFFSRFTRRNLSIRDEKKLSRDPLNIIKNNKNSARARIYMYRFFDDGRNNSFIVRETRLSPFCVLSFRLETDALFHYRFPECRTIKRNHWLALRFSTISSSKFIAHTIVAVSAATLRGQVGNVNTPFFFHGSILIVHPSREGE